MKLQTFEKAQELDLRICECKDTIKHFENIGENNDDITRFSYSEDFNDFHKNVMKFLKAKQSKLEREFENLK